jgi:nucleoside-diphosphate-sugar epimerase|tara:strand:- start:77213 stop:78031 length:819 start_codon:yes stop_codon:yes gene_type:complete
VSQEPARLLIFGKGYTATRLTSSLPRGEWTIDATGQTARPGIIPLDDPTLPDLIARATHILSSTPPADESDPVLDRYSHDLSATEAWVGYLSSTGTYGDTQGAWVDETATVGPGRRGARIAADLGWQALDRPVAIFRLPGIYGPGRSAFDRLRQGKGQRIDAPGQVFSRIHVDDICAAVRAAMSGRASGIYNLADDEPAPASDVTAYAARLLGMVVPPLIPLEEARLSPAARGFYTETRRVANGRMKRDLLPRLRYPDYRSGLAAIHMEETQ